MSDQILDVKDDKKSESAASNESLSAESPKSGTISQLVDLSQNSLSSKSLTQMQKGAESAANGLDGGLSAEMLLLGGQKSMGAAFNEMSLIGLKSSKESTFTKITKKVEELSSESEASKSKIIDEVISLGTEWLDKPVAYGWLRNKLPRRELLKNGNLSQDDTLKGNSLISIISTLNKQKSLKAKGVEVVPEVKIGRGASAEKSTKGRLLSGIGIDTSISTEIDKSYIDFQSKINTSTSIDDLMRALEAMKATAKNINTWEAKNASKENSEEKLSSIKSIKESFGKLNASLKLQDNLTLNVSGFDIQALEKGDFVANTISIKGEIDQGTLNVSGKSIELKSGSFFIADAEVNVNAFDSKFQLGVSVQNLVYTSDELKIGKAATSIIVSGSQVDADAEEVKISNHQIAWQKLAASGSNINIGPLTISEAELEIDGLYNFKVSGAIVLKYSYNDFNLDTELNATANGSIEEGIKDVTVSDSAFSITKGDTTISISGFSYDKNEGLEVENAKAESQILSVKLSGVVQGMKIKQNQFDFESAKLNTEETINIGPVTISTLELGVDKSNGYEFSGSTSVSSNSINLPGISGAASVEVSFAQNSDHWQIDLKGASFDFVILNILNISASDISYENDEFKVGKADLEFTDFGLEGTKGKVENLNINKGLEVSFDKASLKKDNIDFGRGIQVEGASLDITGSGGKYHYDTSGKIKVETNSIGFDSTSELSINASGDVGENNLSIEIKDGSINLTRGSTEINIQGIGYSTEGGIAAEKAEAKSIILGTELNGKVENVQFKEGKIDFDSAELTGDEIELGPLKASEPKINIVKSEGNYQISGSSGISVDISSIKSVDEGSASGKVSFEQKDSSWQLSLEGASFDFVILNKLNISASDISFENDEFKVGKANSKVHLPSIGQKTAEIEDLKFTDGKVDWKSISIEFGSIGIGPGIEVKADHAELKGASENYMIKISGAGGSFEYGVLKGGGSVDVSWNFIKGETPTVEKGQFDVNADDVEPLKGIVPSAVNINVKFPFMAGPVPMEASAGFFVKPELSISLGGKVVFTQSEISVKSNNKLTGSLEMGVNAELGVGSSVVIYVGGWVSGGIKPDLEAGLKLDGKFEKKENEHYKLIKLDLAYDLNAQIEAALKAGLRVKALYVFSKDLFEIEIAKWDLGEAKKKGVFNLVTNDKKPESKSEGILDFNSGSVDAANKFLKEKPVKAETPSELVQSKEISLASTIDEFSDDKIKSNSIFTSKETADKRKEETISREQLIDQRIQDLRDSIQSDTSYITFENEMRTRLKSLDENHSAYISSINTMIDEFNRNLPNRIYQTARGVYWEDNKSKFDLIKVPYNEKITDLVNEIHKTIIDDDYLYFLKESLLVYKVNKHRDKLISGAMDLATIIKLVDKSLKDLKDKFKPIASETGSNFLDKNTYPRTNHISDTTKSALDSLNEFRLAKVLPPLEKGID